MQALDTERARSRAFGFYALALWVGLGTLLEAAHAFKIAAYLDQPERRELLVWGHAHGVGLALVVLAYAAAGVRGPQSLRWGRPLRTAATLVPAGFATSIFGLSETDPGPTIWLVPIGALLLCVSLIGIAQGAAQPDPPSAP